MHKTNVNITGSKIELLKDDNKEVIIKGNVETILIKSLELDNVEYFYKMDEKIDFIIKLYGEQLRIIGCDENEVVIEGKLDSISYKIPEDMKKDGFLTNVTYKYV